MLPNEFILLDAEYTCWEGSMARNWSQVWEHREVVQIGALRIKTQGLLEVVDQLNVISRPKINPLLSTYFSDLTGITQAKLEVDGVDFPVAYDSVARFTEGGTLPVYTWGDGDEAALRETCALHGIEFEQTFKQPYVDIRAHFRSHGVKVENYQSGTVYKSVNAIAQGLPHDALGDVLSMYVVIKALSEQGEPQNG
jgi:inhibitor of KinA sporulation pathway (predicted exonuclease)